MSKVSSDQIGKLGQEDLLSFFFLVFLVFLVYSAVLVNNFGVLDDYKFLYNAVNHNSNTVKLLLGAGRPLNAYLLDWGFRLAGGIEGLVRLRIITLLGFSLLASGLYVFVRRHGLSVVSSLVLTTGVVLSPSFQVYAAWAQHFTTPYAGLLALIAAYQLSRACSPGISVPMATVCKSAILLTMSVLVYQPIAMFFFVGVLISVLTSPQPLQEFGTARLAGTGLAFAFAMVAGYVALKVGQHYYPNGAVRYGLVTDLAGKAKWFVMEPLSNALSFFWVPMSKWSIGISVSAIVVGYMAYAKKYGLRQGCYVLFISVGCVIASYSPNLATAENWASYRSIGALSCVLFTIFVLVAFAPLARRLGMEDRSRSATPKLALLSIIALCLSVSAAGRVSQSLVQPNAMELNNLARFFRLHTEEGVSRIFIRASSWRDSAAKPLLYDEFGMQSSLDDYRAMVIVDLVRRSLHAFPDAQIVSVAYNKPLDVAMGRSEIYVDFPALDAAGSFRSVHSRLKAPPSN